MILRLNGKENSGANIYLVFEAAKAKKGNKRPKLGILHRSCSAASNIATEGLIVYLYSMKQKVVKTRDLRQVPNKGQGSHE